MKNTRLALWAACVFSTFSLEGEEIRLKTRTIVPEVEGKSSALKAAAAYPRSVSGRNWHWIVQFSTSEPDFSPWTERGAQVLTSVPVNAFILSVPEGMSWDNLDFTFRTPIDAADKMSPEVFVANLDADIAPQELSPTLVIVHFHKDVKQWEADAILEAEGVTPISHGSLEVEDRLVEIPIEKMNALALWDEVEYIFPAPAGMKNGDLFLSCGGVLSNGYEVAMLAATYGNGWDGVGKSSASISYSFGPLGNRTDPTQTRAEIRRALSQWSSVVAVNFTETTARTSSRNIDILFATGNHGDPFPFTSGTTVLAHSFYPANPNPEPLAGDIHVNDAWSWSLGGQWDVYSVILHELGHSLGIGHTDVPGSVMYPYYQKATTLTQADIDSIRQLYANAGTTPNAPAPTPLSITIQSPVEGASTTNVSINVSGTLANAGAGVTVSYSNAAGSRTGNCLINSTYTTFTCAAIPLTAGANAITLTARLGSATATASRTVTMTSATDVRLTVTSPAPVPQRTTATQLTFGGTASGTGNIASVNWSTNRSRSGAASGTSTWTANIPLELGSNEITITVTARTGIQTNQKYTVERTATTNNPTPTAPTEDKTPPRMTIQQPIGNFIITSAARLTFKGTATDNVGVRQVTWTNSAGDQSGAATAVNNNGIMSWSFDVNLAVGFNAIQVRAWDTSGNSTLYSTTVRRY